MTMTSNTSPASSRSSTLNDALSLDIQVLTLLLQRNHDQQHRCIYFRRLSMVLLALRRASLDWMIIDELERLSRLAYRQQEEDAVRRKRKLKEEHWTIQRDETDDTIKMIDEDTINRNNNSSDNDIHTIQLVDTIQNIRNLITKSLPQITSRIIHATSPILHELSRGYFVPFMTVALACLGRIHVLVLRLGRELVGTLSQHVPKLREYADGTTSNKGEDELMHQLVEALSPFVGDVAEMKDGSESSNEWNEIIKPFTEVSHDDFTKKMAFFVKEKRWKDAVIALGIKEEDLREMQRKSQKSDTQGNDGDGEDDNMNTDDMGELVYTQQDKDDDSNKDVDDNMARVLNKRRIDDSAPTPAKKKRRKKKKKSSDTLEAAALDADDELTNIRDERVNVESRQSADNIEEVTESAKVACALTNSVDEPVQQSTLSAKESSNKDDEVMMDAQNEAEKGTKKPKKSKKKKTKKKKSKNVIDDIFG